MLQLKKVSVKVGKKEILKDFNFEFEKGKVYAVMGPNGSGKSTLAYAIAGHPAYKLDVGSLKLDGKEIRDKKPEDGNISFVSKPLVFVWCHRFSVIKDSIR